MLISPGFQDGIVLPHFAAFHYFAAFFVCVCVCALLLQPFFELCPLAWLIFRVLALNNFPFARHLFVLFLACT